MLLTMMNLLRNSIAPLAFLVALPLVANAAGEKTPNQSPGPATNESTNSATKDDRRLEGRALAKTSNAFAADLWKQFAKMPGNLAISPASISSSLTMLCGGAKGETDRQIRNVLHIDGDAQTAGERWGHLVEELENPVRSLTPLTLRIANRLFGEETFIFEQSYLDWTSTAFGAALEPISFIDAADVSRTHINAWVDERTEHHIRDLLPPSSLDADTRLVLVNAIYFHANWWTQFEKKATSQAPFSVSPSQKKDVSTMHIVDTFHVVKAPRVKILELPYDRDFAMLIVLPNRIDGLADIEKKMSAATIETWMKAVTRPVSLDGDAPSDPYNHNTAVSLPRFEIDLSALLPLGDKLQALGMPLAFSENADFTGIATPAKSGRGLLLSKVFHKAIVKVDEEGTEATAATALDIELVRGIGQPELEFNADHPFLFFIVNEPSRLILFMGRVSDPSLGRGI